MFYRLRMESALALVKFDTPELDSFGLTQLLKYLDGYMEDGIPKCNRFEDLQEYYILCSVLKAISLWRDEKGWSPSICRSTILQFLKWNDNTLNVYSDSNYLALLIDCLGDTFLKRPKGGIDSWVPDRHTETRTIRNEDVEEFEFPVVEEAWDRLHCETVKTCFGNEDLELLDEALAQVSRYLVRDRFSPSFQNSVTVACLEVFCVDVVVDQMASCGFGAAQHPTLFKL
jgi:hypothetical protein